MESSKNTQPGHTSSSVITVDKPKTVSTGSQTGDSVEALTKEVRRLVDETLKLRLGGNIQILQQGEKEDRDITEWDISSIKSEHHEE